MSEEFVDDISLCSGCGCMTKNICGKCNTVKGAPPPPQSGLELDEDKLLETIKLSASEWQRGELPTGMVIPKDTFKTLAYMIKKRFGSKRVEVAWPEKQYGDTTPEGHAIEESWNEAIDNCIAAYRKAQEGA